MGSGFVSNVVKLSPEQVKVLNVVILSVSVLSVLGAGWIILSFIVRQPLAFPDRC